MKKIWMMTLAVVFVGCGVNDRSIDTDGPNDGKSETPATQQPPEEEGPSVPPIAPPPGDFGTCARSEQCVAPAPFHPRWCENGVLVDNGYDDIGCKAPTSCLRLDGATCGGPGTMDCHNGLECSAERDLDNFGTCVRTIECIAAAPPHPRWCENGELVQNGYDDIGCMAPASCLRLDGATCDDGYMSCHNGLECSTERDADGFGTCVRIDECIAAAPPHPQWCENGVLVQNGYDDIGCMAPPTCLRLEGATCDDQLSMQCHNGLTCN